MSPMSSALIWKELERRPLRRRARDFVLVTNNAGDYRRLYAAEPLHPGLIILIPNVRRASQRRLFRGALAQLAVIGEPVNQVLEIDLDGDDVTFALYDLPGKTP